MNSNNSALADIAPGYQRIVALLASAAALVGCKPGQLENRPRTELASQPDRTNSNQPLASPSSPGDTTQYAPVSTSADQIPFNLTAAQVARIAEQIFRNETGGDRNKLLFWSPNEDFPSLGIGHFIWFPRNAAAARQRFGSDSFPDLIRFLQSEGEAIPAVIKNTLPDLHCPWPSRSHFESISSQTKKAIIDFLDRTKAKQMHHILNRFQRTSHAFATGKNGILLSKRIAAVAQSPSGPYPLIDYVNFKGEGTSNAPGKWGLQQVLLDMKAETDPSRAHEEFSAAADRVLTRRAQNNPSDTVFLEGWRMRIQTYRTFRM